MNFNVFCETSWSGMFCFGPASTETFSSKEGLCESWPVIVNLDPSFGIVIVTSDLNGAYIRPKTFLPKRLRRGGFFTVSNKT